MRNRTALTTAVTSSAPDPESRPAPGSLVFGKVARPGDAGPGARTQDVELFDVTLTAPRTPGEGGPRARHGAGRPRHGRKASRARRAVKAPERERRGMSLPLLIAGALAAGAGLSVGLTSRSDQAPPDVLTLAVPDVPPPSATPDTAPPPAPVRRPTATVTPVAAPAATAHRAPVHTSAPPATHRPKPAPSRGPRPSARPGADTLGPGSTGPEVEELQRRLGRLHLYLGSVDGTFGPYLAEALSRFQASRAIPEQRGVYGPLTRAALRAETDRDDRRDRDGWNGWNDDDRGGRSGWGG
ncbi:peptidoglycan-binding protein [Streptomyces sp. NPDC058084]|uniref:peptidoglycan-binding domain-containing protein n=1 Tax=Streptomyces sp. NPDC058084 TaxID=3346333 RepID=UPI0036F0596C